jgi:multimeric flavodoxin WrbA
MKVLALNGSPRKDGNTSLLIKEVFTELEKEGIETELIQLGGRPIHGCIACMKCGEKKNSQCALKGDSLNDHLAKMFAADGIILGSPVYFTDVTSEMKALIDRAGFVARQNGHLLRRKVGAGVVAVRRAGSVHTFDTLNHFFTINQMVVPGSDYWNMGIGLQPGDVSDDKEGMNTMRILGSNMAWLLKKLHA